MHIHSMNYPINGISSAAAIEHVADRQRAADMRKKLRDSAARIEGASGPDEDFLVGHWMDSQHSQMMDEDEYHPAAQGKDPDFG
jgi:hypothetical protein